MQGMQAMGILPIAQPLVWIVGIEFDASFGGCVELWEADSHEAVHV